MNKKILEIAIEEFNKLRIQYDGFINVAVDDWRGFRFIFDTKDCNKCKYGCSKCPLYLLLKNSKEKGKFSPGLYKASKKDKLLFGLQKYLNCKTLKQYQNCYSNFLVKETKTKREIKNELKLLKNFRIIFSRSTNNLEQLENNFRKSVIKDVLLKTKGTKRKIIIELSKQLFDFDSDEMIEASRIKCIMKKGKMDKIKAQTLKGFRDFLPLQMRKRQYVINKLKGVFESFGFEPMETPALEYEEILLGKYGEEGDKLMYRFTDNGDRKVALRYDQTVPLARVVAEYGNQLPTPFKRYQIQPVWRAENTQKGRFREFLQCDIDTIGVSSPLADAEIVSAAAKSLDALGFKNYKILINDRSLFGNLLKREVFSEKTLQVVIRAMDKIKKIGREKVMDEMIEKGIPSEQATYAIQTIEQMQPTENLQEIFKSLKELGVDESKFEFSPTLARGLDYYTGIIFEIEIEGYGVGSVAGGGRFDNLIGMFTKEAIPAVGMAFGFDRIIDAMEEQNLFPEDLMTTKVLVTIFSKDLEQKSIEVASRLRSNNINSELWLDPETKLDKQLKYADQKQIPNAAIIGPDEASKDQITLKNLKEKTQETLSLDAAIQKLTS